MGSHSKLFRRKDTDGLHLIDSRQPSRQTRFFLFPVNFNQNKNHLESNAGRNLQRVETEGETLFCEIVESPPEAPPSPRLELSGN